MNTKSSKHGCIADIIRIMDALAPPQLAEEWDNCGLQVGHLQWPVRKIWVALDPLLPVIRAASQNHVDMVITHHPLILKPLYQIDLGTTEGEIIETALKSHTAIYAAHTNLDSVSGGINDVLARKIGLTQLKTLLPPTVSRDGDLDADDAMPTGLGRVGRLEAPATVEQLARRIKTIFKLDQVKVAGDPQCKVKSVAICSGSGSSLLNTFLKSDADVYVSGDLKYHDARVVEHAGRALIDMGHFASEHLIVRALVERLSSVLENDGWNVEIEACSLEQDPFDYL